MAKKKERSEAEPLRVRLPKENETIGIVEVRLGYGKSRVRCVDGKTRLCRVPGHLKRYIWVRPNNIVLVKPWEIGGETRGDIIYIYKDTEIEWLKKKGLLKKILEEGEF